MAQEDWLADGVCSGARHRSSLRPELLDRKGPRRARRIRPLPVTEGLASGATAPRVGQPVQGDQRGHRAALALEIRDRYRVALASLNPASLARPRATSLTDLQTAQHRQCDNWARTFRPPKTRCMPRQTSCATTGRMGRKYAHHGAPQPAGFRRCRARAGRRPPASPAEDHAQRSP